MDTIHLYQLPYDSGRRDWRAGRGPGHFLAHGLEDALRATGCQVRTSRIEVSDPALTEIQTAFDLYRSLAGEVFPAVQAGEFPLVLSGNCGAALGGLAGAAGEHTGLVWLDAHGDFNTPETTVSGFLDGMGLAIAAGLCWRTVAGSIPHFRPLPGAHIVHVGSSDIETAEAGLMQAAGVRVIPATVLRAGGLVDALAPALEDLRQVVSQVYLHIDLDVLDAAQWPANQLSRYGGLKMAEVQELAGLLRRRFELRGAGVASYDPDYDPQGSTLQAGIEIMRAIC
ncbi:MAG: arginase family protein, partial [Chloroflexi bacterium]|nr:arginase family protein [Chloroflexota bacterium]